MAIHDARIRGAALRWLERLPREEPHDTESLNGTRERAVDVLAVIVAKREGAAAHEPAADDPAVSTAARQVLEIFRELCVPANRIGEALRSLRASIDNASDAAGDVPHDRTVDSRLVSLTAAIAQAVAEDASRIQRELAGNLEVFSRTLAHELKNPLGAAEGAVQMLLDPTVSNDAAQRRRFAEMVGRNVRRATELVNDLRMLVMASTRDENVRRRSLQSIAEDVLHEVAPAAQERGIRVSVLQPVPDVRVDAARGTLVLMNLAWNAVKYSDAAKQERWVRIGAGLAAEDSVHCYVADNGVGIAPADHERVFERFERAHTRLASGTGLGLSIAREALAQLGGRIWLESEPALGSTFHFTLPVEH